MTPWPGQPISGHRGLPDPVKATGTTAEKGLVFAPAYAALRRLIDPDIVVLNDAMAAGPAGGATLLILSP